MALKGVHHRRLLSSTGSDTASRHSLLSDTPVWVDSGEAAGEYPAMRFLSLVPPPSPATAGRHIKVSLFGHIHTAYTGKYCGGSCPLRHHAR